MAEDLLDVAIDIVADGFGHLIASFGVDSNDE